MNKKNLVSILLISLLLASCSNKVNEDKNTFIKYNVKIDYCDNRPSKNVIIERSIFLIKLNGPFDKNNILTRNQAVPIVYLKQIDQYNQYDTELNVCNLTINN